MPLLRINRTPPPLQLRVFAAAFGLASGVLALKLRRHGLEGPSVAATGIGVVGILVGMVAPGTLRWPYLALSYVTYPIGFVLSYAILAILFYGVIVPIGLAFRAFGYDPLRRKPSRAASFWEVRPPTTDPKRYLQQS